jgi:hypothetical protein
MKNIIAIRWIFTVLFLLIVTTPIFAQQHQIERYFMTKLEYYNYLAKKRGYKEIDTSLKKPLGVEHRKRSILNVGNVTARIRNSATLGYEKTDGLCYEFPSGSGITYRWTMAPIVGAIVNGQKRVACGTFGAARQNEDEFEPIGGLDAGWSDDIGNYGIAASDRPDTWPATWPTSDPLMPVVGSNGFPGILSGEVVATRELYFAVTDHSINQNDTLNIRIDIWGIQYENFINEDFIIYKMIVTNIGQDTLHDVYIGIHDDPDTPEQGDAEWTDDFAAFIPQDTDVDGYTAAEDSLLWDFSYLWDGDDKAEGFIPSKVAWVGLKVLETPDDPNNAGTPMGLTTIDVFPYSYAPQAPVAEYDQLASGIKAPDNAEPHPDDWTQTPNTWGPDITYAIASGPFELEPGETLNFALASIHGVNKKDLFNNAMLCQTLYNNDYASAEAPPVPNVRAVVGDHSVTLYWDAYPTEYAVYPDGHVGDKLTGNNAFEGYKIFRSTDRGLNWGEVMIDVDGAPRGYIPLVQYDLLNGIQGESETRPFFYLGDDTGLKHSFTDHNVENGFEYWYAVLAYDHDDGPIPPLQNAFKNDAYLPDDNIIAVIPRGKISGFQEGLADTAAQHVAGGSDIDYIPIEVVDPGAITGDLYEISFNESEEGKTFTVTNKNINQIVYAGEKKVENWEFYDQEIDNAPIFDGIKLAIVDIDYGVKEISGSSSSYGTDYELYYWDYYVLPPEVSHDYEIEFTSETYDIFSIWRIIGYDEPNSVANFKVTDLNTGEQINSIWMDAGDYNLDYDHGENIFLNHTSYGTEPTDYSGYGFYLEVENDPAVGDIITIITDKPLSSEDKYEFQTYKESYAGLTENDLSKITTVPNPFVVSSRFEVGAYGLEKTVQFHFLPPECTIRIFNIAGDLVQTIEHTNGTSIESWNLQSYNEQEVAFGVYFYHVDAEGIGEYIGKMAIIK